jgi:drug/metabolite transporter (DMT)-like permease
MNLSSSELLPVLMIITGGVLYHVAQKATPKGVDPFLALFLSFGLAALGCLCFSIFRNAASAAQFRSINWTSFVLGFSLIAIESGYLIGYRAGLKLNITSFACNNLIALVLFVVGTLVYAERFSARNASGAILCLIGLLLLR